MIVCKECGQSNRDADSFCGSCGGFLEWTGEKRAQAPAAVAVAQEAPPRQGLVRRLAAAIAGPPTTIDGKPIPPEQAAGEPAPAPADAAAGAPPAAGAKPPAPPPPPPSFGDDSPPPPPPSFGDDPPPPMPSFGDDPPAPPSFGATAPPRFDDGDARTADLVAPVEPAPTHQVDNAGVLPQETVEVTGPKHRAPSTRRIRAGDKVCGECGEGNPATRKFCGRCGESLTTAELARPSWWRRLLPRRGPKLVAAAKRPKAAKRGGHRRVGSRALTGIRRYLFVAVLGFALLAGLYPPLRTYVVTQFTNVRTWAGGLIGEAAVSPVRPTAVFDTDTQLADHPAKAAFDGFGNTYWAAPWVANGKQPVVTVDLGKPTALSKVVITSGASDDYMAHNRPSILVFTYSNEKSDTITLQDSKQPQTFSLRNGLAAKEVRVQVLQINESAGAGDVAITELQFFGVG